MLLLLLNRAGSWVKISVIEGSASQEAHLEPCTHMGNSWG